MAKAGGFSAKWYLSAFPDKEVNKGYGLVQNRDGDNENHSMNKENKRIL